MKVIICIFTVLSIFAFRISAQEDSLTSRLCDNQEQIYTRTNAVRIEYVMGEYELNVKTVKGYLHNNAASKPYLSKYSALRVASAVMAGVGLGLIGTNIALDKPMFAPVGIAGWTMVIGAGVVFFKSNGKFRIAIHEYNKNLCKIK